MPDQLDRRRPLAVLLLDLVAPIALYYGLRGLGVPVVAALLIGAAPPTATAVMGIVRDRRVDPLAATVILALVASTAATLLGGGPRFLLVRDALVTTMWGLWMIGSVRAQRPMTYVFSRPLLEGRRIFDPSTHRLVRPSPDSWETLWQQLPRFRRIWRVSSVIWGSALILDAAVRISIAYLLPLDTVPALNGALWPVTFVILQIVTNVQFARSGLWRILRDGTTADAHQTPTGSDISRDQSAVRPATNPGQTTHSGQARWGAQSVSMTHNQFGLTIAAVGGAAFVFANVGSFAAPVAIGMRMLAGLALLMVIAAVWRRSAPTEGVEVSGGHALSVVVTVEVAAIAGGLVLLNGVLDAPGAGVAWIATIVGVHFFALARLWHIPPMNLLAAALTACGLVGGLLVAVDAGQASVDAVAGVLSGAVLLGFCWVARPPTPVVRAS